LIVLTKNEQKTETGEERAESREQSKQIKQTIETLPYGFETVQEDKRKKEKEKKTIGTGHAS